MRLDRLSAWLLGCGLYLSAAPSQAVRYSAYEQSVIRSALSGRGERIDPNPEGKVIEDIRFVLIDVFDERDPVPKWLNLFHARTRREVVARELLFASGERYSQARVDETARNLRGLFQLSLVLLVPLEGASPDRVRVLVMTKDVWSLRLGWTAQVQRFELLRLDSALTEVNLAGMHQTVAAQFGLDPASYYVGGAYENLRVSGSRIHARARAGVILNRSTGRAEGSFGSLLYGQPLYSLATKWAWSSYFAWRKDIEREFVGSRIQTYNAIATPERDAIPRVWNRDLLFGQYALIRSFGTHYKFDWSFGAEASRAVFRSGDLSANAPAAVTEFERVILPVTDQRVSPFVALRARTADFLRTLDFETLALQEDVLLGHDLTVKVYPASRAVGSTRDLVGLNATLSYTIPVGDGIVRAVAVSNTEISRPAETDAMLRGTLRVTSPSLGFGRLVFDATVIDRYEDYFRQRYILGGNGRLRGFMADEFKGRDVVAANLEYRTPPLNVLSVQVGGALFYDVGDAFDRFSAFCPKQGAGFGGRFVFPQLERGVWRLDWGFALDDNHACDLAHGRALAVTRRDPWQGLFLGFDQAFDLPRTQPTAIPENLAR
jgi:hypothetical protein